MTPSKQEAEDAVRTLLAYIGEDVNREGLQETPARVVKAMGEVFYGAQLTNDEIAAMHGKCFVDGATRDMVVVRDIPCFSFCEHHLMLMYDMTVSIAYLPNGKILGLSKFARIAKAVCARPQVQERIGADIASIIGKVTGTENVAVYIRAKHSCMTARGANSGGYTKTATLRGRFLTDERLRAEAIAALS